MDKSSLALCFGIALASPVCAVENPASGPCPKVEAIQREIVAALIAARSTARNCGGRHFGTAGPLAWNSVLFKAAERHAQDMSHKGYFSHNSPDGRSPLDHIHAAGYQQWRIYGENIVLVP